MDSALKELQENIYTLTQELLGITGLNNIHELMAIAIEMHCNDDMLMQRLQHINKHKEHKKAYEKKSIYPGKYYWNPDNSELDLQKSP
jgi:hypothetical protein